jgi:hypothetical protein
MQFQEGPPAPVAVQQGPLEAKHEGGHEVESNADFLFFLCSPLLFSAGVPGLRVFFADF